MAPLSTSSRFLLSLLAATASSINAFVSTSRPIRDSKPSFYNTVDLKSAHSHQIISANSNNNKIEGLFMSASAAFPEGESSWDKKSSSDSSSSSSPKQPSSAFGPRRPLSPEDSIPHPSSSKSGDDVVPMASQPPSPERLSRIKREADIHSRFLHNDELVELRQYMKNLEEDLVDARKKGDTMRLSDVKKALLEAKNMDAEYVYNRCMEKASIADKNGLHDEAMEYRKEALEARDCLPQFNLQGLWVGKYGDHGYEMINVTYVGDTLIATKVTGDKNVPKGERTFTADLDPRRQSGEDLSPIELTPMAAKQWGQKHLPRFPGQGQVAAEGFTSNQWMDGQLILVGEYFSFAWVPIGHQIFFGRPSAELTLKMLKQSEMAKFGAVDSGSPNAIAEMRASAQRCLEETEMIMHDDIGVEGELIFSSDDEAYFSQEGCFE